MYIPLYSISPYISIHIFLGAGRWLGLPPILCATQKGPETTPPGLGRSLPQPHHACLTCRHPATAPPVPRSTLVPRGQRCFLAPRPHSVPPPHCSRHGPRTGGGERGSGLKPRPPLALGPSLPSGLSVSLINGIRDGVTKPVPGQRSGSCVDFFKIKTKTLTLVHFCSIHGRGGWHGWVLGFLDDSGKDRTLDIQLFGPGWTEDRR